MTSTYTPNDSPFPFQVEDTYLKHRDVNGMSPGDHARLYQQWLSSQLPTTNAIPFSVYLEEYLRNLNALQVQAREKPPYTASPQSPQSPVQNMSCQMFKYAAHLEQDPKAYKCWRELTPDGQYVVLTTHPAFAPDRFFVQVDIPVRSQNTDGDSLVFHVETLIPEEGQTVWIPSITTSTQVVSMIFSSRDPRHLALYNLGLIHSTEEAAAKHLEAVISPSRSIKEKVAATNKDQSC